ncbi:MAG: tetratricopeptide repeat protein [Fimbriimonadales bacterium]|nr:tetratricopeptide repeat protein [Fimbriimonadales bacterium]
MQRVAFSLLLIVLLARFGCAQPSLLIFADPAPPLQHEDKPYDPNVDLQPYLTPFLQELRKVRVEWYTPRHPVAQQFAQRRDLSAEQLANPNPVLRAQLARAWGATYVMTVRCTRPPQKTYYEYAITVWELGRRAPVWEAEGFQQLATARGAQDEASALRTLGRTIAMRLDSELWGSLPQVAAQVLTPTPPPALREPPPPTADPKQLAEELLKADKYQEALPALRALVNAEPENPAHRLQLIRLYRRLNLPALAQAELERAAQLFPDNEAILLEWIALLQSEGNLSEAVARLQAALAAHPDSQPLRLTLFDLLLQSGDTGRAARVLEPLAHLNSEEVQFRRYLLRGAMRQLENLPLETVPLTEARSALWLQVASGLLADLSGELLDMRRLATAPSPNWGELRKRSEQVVLTALNIGQWLERAQPDNATRALVAHARFAGQMLSQSAQHMARFVLSRKADEEERASLLRIEAMRELESAKNALPKRQP